MSKALHDYVWDYLRKAEAHEPHDQREMFSLQSKSTPFAWGCTCGMVEYTYVAHDRPPVCIGGYDWSFTTTDPTQHDR